MEEIHERATALLWAIWRGIAPDYKSRYRRSIWRQFEDRVRSAAYTSNLGTFVNTLCSSLQAEIGKNADDRERAHELLNAGDERALLKVLREETTLVVLMVRIRNQEAQEAYEVRRAETEALESALDGPLFAGVEEEE
jgi:hypothetical protein